MLHQGCASSRNVIEDIVIGGKELAEKMGLDEPRMRQKKMISGEVTRDAGHTGKEDLKRIMRACIGRFLSKLDKRFRRLDDLDKKFGFLLHVKMTFSMETVPVWLEENCGYVADQYSEVGGNDLRFEITDVISLIKVPSNVFKSSPIDLLLLLNMVMMLFQI